MTTLEMLLLGVLASIALLAFWRERGLRDAILDLEAHAKILTEGRHPELLPDNEGGVVGKAFAAFDELARVSTEREQSRLRGGLAALQLVARTVDEREEFTRGRYKRVNAYAVSLAWQAGLHLDEVRRVGDAASLIDIGKIAIPDHILKKPGVLTDAEKDMLDTHPIISECIARRMPGLDFALPGILHHHERWDGGGYPGRLAGENIPQMARIIAIADAFDAMTSDRPHRPGFAQEVALDIIERAAGHQFDPHLARLFVDSQRHKTGNEPAIEQVVDHHEDVPLRRAA